MERHVEYSQFIILQSIPNFLRYTTKVAQTNPSGVVIIEELECTTDLFHRITRKDALAHW